MRIDRALNLVVPVYEDDGKTVRAYVHSTPLSTEQIERHFMLLGQTFNAIFKQGLGETAGPAYAMMLLKRIATNTGEWQGKDGTPGPGQELVEEIRRMTMVSAPKVGGGWEPVPLQVAVERKVVSAEDKAEVENAIVFFIVVSATLKHEQRREMIAAASDLWGARTSSLNSTEFTSSLATSTATGSSGETSHAAAADTSGSATATVDGKPSSIPS